MSKYFEVLRVNNSSQGNVKAINKKVINSV